MRVRFTQSPTGQPHYLAYNVAEIADVPDAVAESLIAGGFAEPYGESEPPANTRQLKYEKAEKRGSKQKVHGNNPASQRTADTGGGEGMAKG